MTKIMLIAGEASGDAHGARLVAALKKLDPQVECFGIGGSAMQEAGCEILFDARNIAVVGLVEVLKHYPLLKRAWKIALGAMTYRKPDLLILIDYPGFNLRLAKRAKAMGIKVLYYVSPQIWAWHQSRIHTIKQRIDHMVVIFPFEVKYYEAVQIPVNYFGNPLVEHLLPIDQTAARTALHLHPQDKIIGLLPGSRKSEISRLLPLLAHVVEGLRSLYPDMKFLLPIASTLQESELKAYLPPHLPIQYVKNNAHQAMAACDVLIGASGTVTLEAALLGIPMIIIYKMNPLTYWLAKKLIKVKYIGLANLLANQRLMPELIQDQAQPQKIIEETVRFLENEGYRKDIIEGLAQVRKQLGRPGAAKKAAELALELSAQK